MTFDKHHFYAKMSAALMAWRRVAESMRGIATASDAKRFGPIFDDLEEIAAAFDALPEMWAYIEDLERKAAARLPASVSDAGESQ
jgi:hypothetical protein